MAPDGSQPRSELNLSSPAMTAIAARPARAPARERLRWHPAPSTALLIGAVVLVCLGVVGNCVQAARHGWVLEGDNAAIAINVWDTAHGHFRMVGPPTSASNYSGIGAFYHPGPMIFWLAVVPAGLFGWGAGGFLFYAALVNCAALIGVAVLVRRRAGDLVATGFVAASALLVWGVGSEVPHDVWNPHIAVLPWLLALVALWSVLDGDRAALVVLAAAVSFSMQDHFSYLPVAGPLMVGSAVVLALRLRRQRRDEPHAWPAARRGWGRAGLAALVVLVACWLPVAIQQVTGRSGNVSQLVRYVSNGPPKGRQGASYAVGRFFGFLGYRPLWLDRSADIFDVLRDPSALDVVVALALVTAAAGLAWHHLRRGRPAIGRLLVLCLAALVLLAVSTASLPKDVLSSAIPYNYLPWSPVCLLTLVGIAWGGVEAAASRRSRHEGSRRWKGPAQLGTVAATLALSVATVAMTGPGQDRSTWAFPAIRQIDRELRTKLPKDGPYYVIGRGAMAYLSLTNPIVLDLIRHGYQVRIPTDREEFLGTFRRVDRGRLAGIVLVTSGVVRDQDVPPGSKLLVRVPAGPGHPATDDPATSYPVAVYLVPTSQLDRVGGFATPADGA